MRNNRVVVAGSTQLTIEQIAVALLVWIASHSSYKTAGQLPPPPIVLMSAQQLTALVSKRVAPSADAVSGQWRIHGY